LQPREPSPADGYRLIDRLPDTSSVWQVTARAAPAFVMLSGGFGLPRRLDNGTIGYPLVASGGVAVMEIHAKQNGVVRIVLDASAPGGERDMRIQDAKGEHPYGFTGSLHIDVNVAVPRGVSQLLLKVDPAATSEADAVMLSQPRVEASNGAATLTAIPTSAKPGF
jgi:hypothetical protein